jgi:hypothetical protein
MFGYHHLNEIHKMLKVGNLRSAIICLIETEVRFAAEANS